MEDEELRPSDFAVAFRQIAPHLSLARQVFAEYQLPLDPATGDALRDRPFGAWLRRLLHLGTDGWRLADLNAVMDGGFMDLGRWNLTREDVRAFTRKARKDRRWRGHPTLMKAAGSLEDSRAREGMARAMEDLGSLLEDPVDSLEERARQWETALFGETPLIDSKSLNRPDAESGLKEIGQHLRDLISVQQALGGCESSFEAFANWLESRMEAPSLLLREVGGVVLAPIRALPGLRFHSVFVGGLVEGEFPAPRVSTALLNENALDALSAVRPPAAARARPFGRPALGFCPLPRRKRPVSVEDPPGLPGPSRLRLLLLRPAESRPHTISPQPSHDNSLLHPGARNSLRLPMASGRPIPCVRRDMPSGLL